MWLQTKNKNVWGYVESLHELLQLIINWYFKSIIDHAHTAVITTLPPPPINMLFFFGIGVLEFLVFRPDPHNAQCSGLIL